MIESGRKDETGESASTRDSENAVTLFKEMFIVRDHREIPQILKDPKDERTVLSFSRR